MRKTGVLAVLSAILVSSGYGDTARITFTHGGRPVAHAAVTAQLASPGQPFFMQDRVTGSDGEATFDLGSVKAGSRPLTGVVCAPNRNFYLFSAIAKSQRLELQGPLSPVTVRVRDRNGKPVPGTTVAPMSASLRSGALGNIHGPGFRRKTDAKGLVSIGSFPVGAQLSLLVDAPGYICVSREFEPLGPGKQVIEQTVAKTGYISGRVLRDGHPVEGAEVTGSYEMSANMWSSVQAKSQHDGTYRLTMPAGRCAVSASIPDSDLITDAVNDMIVVEDRQLGHVNFRFREGIPVRVRVTRKEDKTPVPDVGVRESSDMNSVVKQTGQDGYVTFHVRPGQVYFAVDGIHGINHPNLESSWVPISKDQHPDVQFTVPKAMTVSPVDHLTGKVTNPDGTPAKGAKLTVLEDQSVPRLNAVADARGSFRFQQQITGGAHVMAKLGHRISRPVEVGLSPLNLALTDKEGTISGTVVDERGTPMSGVAVSLGGKIGLGFAYTNTTSDPSGRYRFDGLSGDFDSFYLWFKRRGYGAESIQPVKVKPGEDRLLPKQTLEPADGRITGSVVDYQGHSVPNVKVTGQNRGGEAISDDHGRFVLTGVTRGKVFVVAWTGQTSNGGVEAKTGQKDVVLKLDPARSGQGQVSREPQNQPQRRVPVDPEGSTSSASLFLAGFGGLVLIIAFGIRQLSQRGQG